MPSTKPTADFTYTDQELLDLWREALAVVSIKGQTYEISGRKLSNFDLREIREQVEYFEARVNASSGLAVNLSRFRR